jgi:hypothetical protein
MSKQWEKEITALFQEAQELEREYQTESVLLSEDQKRKKKEAITAKRQEAEALRMQYYGPEGELYTKRAELIQPIQELLGIHVHITINDLGEAINENMGNIIVAGIQAGNKAHQTVIAVDGVLVGSDQTNVRLDIVHQLIILCQAQNVTVLHVHSSIDEVDHLLGLTGALDTHDDSNHCNHSLSLCIEGKSFDACYNMLSCIETDFKKFTKLPEQN